MPTWCFLCVQPATRVNNSKVNPKFGKIFCEALEVYGLGNKGMQPARVLDWNDRNPESFDRNLGEILTKAQKDGIKFLVVILPDSKADVFSRIKFWADTELGKSTQENLFACMQADALIARPTYCVLPQVENG